MCLRILEKKAKKAEEKETFLSSALPQKYINRGVINLDF
jgi:hypothetical protein